MSKTKASQVTEQLENLDSSGEINGFEISDEEVNENEMSDDEIDEYLADSKPSKIDGVFDAQSNIFSARFLHTRKVNDLAFLKMMGKPRTSPKAIKMLADDENAKVLADLWCAKTPNAADIENFLKKHPVDSSWYFISILANMEKNGISKGEITERAKVKAVRIRNASSGGKAKPNKLAEYKSIIFDHWLKWQEQPDLFKSVVAFAEKMHYESDDVVAVERIKAWCYRWKNIRLLQISNSFA